MRVMVHVVGAELQSKPVLWNLIQLYTYEFSEFTHQTIDEHGEYTYRWFDNYWTDPDRFPYLITNDAHLAGFAFVLAGSPHDMAEFFVLSALRRGGIGIDAARQLFELHPGTWQVRQMAANARATAFWHRAIPVPFEEVVDDHGPRQLFQIEPLGIEGP